MFQCVWGFRVLPFHHMGSRVGILRLGLETSSCAHEPSYWLLAAWVWSVNFVNENLSVA